MHTDTQLCIWCTAWLCQMRERGSHAGPAAVDRLCGMLVRTSQRRRHRAWSAADVLAAVLALVCLVQLVQLAWEPER